MTRSSLSDRREPVQEAVRPGAARAAASSAPRSPRTPTRPLALGVWDAASGTGLWGQALPASVWHRVLGDVTVTLEVEGGPASVWSARSGRRRLLTRRLSRRHRIRLASDGPDWLWVEGLARSVTWSVDAAVDLPPVTVVMPTMRREPDAIAQARRFAHMDAVHRVIVVDQGGTLASLPDFRQLLHEHPIIHLITQSNLGGSGGYARGMLEASQDPAAAVLFSDDDAVLSEESLRRMLIFQTLAKRPTIVGTPLFAASPPTRLLAHSEKVDARLFQWRSTDRMRKMIDLKGTSPVDWTFTSGDAQVNYTGWWGTLFPPGTATELGLPAPLFLKWDDAEYGLRATAHGYDHDVLPGTAVHHPQWTTLRTQMTWTARVLHRNRLAIAAAYGAGHGVIASSLVHQIKHVLAGHLLTAELWEDGIDTMCAGPGAWLGHDLRTARADGDRIVRAWHRRHDPATPPGPTRTSPLPLPAALLRSLSRLLRPDSPPRLVLAVPADEVHWRTTIGADAVVVTSAEGTTETTFASPGSAMRRALGRTLRSHLRLALHWRSLRRQYARELHRHTTAAAWSAHFGSTPPDRPTERN